MVSVASDINTRRQHSIFELLRNKAFSIPCLFSSFAAFVLLARSHLYANDLNEQQVWTIGLGVVSGVAILRWLCGFPADPNRSLSAKWGWYLQSLTILQIVLLLSISTKSPSALGPIWLIVFLSEAIWWSQNYRRRQNTTTRPINDTPLGYVIEDDLEARLLRSLEDHSRNHSTPSNNREIPDHASQLWVRSTDILGETISASQRVQFVAGQRHQNLHLSFVPELPSIPYVEATLIEGPDVDIIVGEAQEFGLRLDLKLGQVYEEPVEVFVQLEVFAEAKQAA